MARVSSPGCPVALDERIPFDGERPDECVDLAKHKSAETLVASRADER
jgi:hypothetical protein